MFLLKRVKTIILFFKHVQGLVFLFEDCNLIHKKIVVPSILELVCFDVELDLNGICATKVTISILLNDFFLEDEETHG